MRNTYRGFYDLSSDEIASIWQDGLVVMDTNVLLDLYRQSPATRATMLAVLNHFQNQLWIPHQVGYEFQTRRTDVRREISSRHGELASELTNQVKKLKDKVDALAKFNGSIDATREHRDNLTTAATELAKNVVSSKSEYSDDVKNGEDTVLTAIERLYPDEQIGAPFSAHELDEHRKKGADRFLRKQPPGHLDTYKGGDAQFGDYFLWVQLMDRANRTEKDVIFVTRDEKADWQSQGRALPDLVDEFSRSTGRNFKMYHPDTFVRDAIRHGFTAEVDQIDEAAEELRDLSQQAAISQTERMWRDQVDLRMSDTRDTIMSTWAREVALPDINRILGNEFRASWTDAIGVPLMERGFRVPRPEEISEDTSDDVPPDGPIPDDLEDS
jgi:rRNA-processing protein FCF1